MAGRHRKESVPRWAPPGSRWRSLKRQVSWRWLRRDFQAQRSCPPDQSFSYRRPRPRSPGHRRRDKTRARPGALQRPVSLTLDAETPLGRPSRRRLALESPSSAGLMAGGSGRQERSIPPNRAGAPTDRASGPAWHVPIRWVFATGRSCESWPPLLPARRVVRAGMPPARIASRVPKRAKNLWNLNRPSARRTGAKRDHRFASHLEQCGALAARARPAFDRAARVSARTARRRGLRESASDHHLVQGILNNALGIRSLQAGNNFPGRRLFDDCVHRHPSLVAQRGNGGLLQGR